MARTAPPIPDRKWWQASTLRWLAPIAATAALAVAVWVKSPGQRHAAPSPPASFVPAPSSETASSRPSPSAAEKAAAPAEKATERAVERRKAESSQLSNLAETPAGPAAERAAAPVAQPQRSEVEGVRTRDLSGARDASAVPSPAPPQLPVEAQSAAPRAVAETVVIAPTQAFAAAKAGAPLAIQSPRPDVVWRIVAGTSVERSTDGGATWQPQSTGAPVRLTAGAAPSSTTCWLVGAGGVVLVSQDGQRWQRVAFPEAVDLTAVRAINGLNATVTAADGRVFSTTDGGKSWR